MTEPQGRRSERLGIRTTPEQKAALEAASRMEGTTVSDFVLTHATEAAQSLLADQQRFVLSPDGWDEFVRVLDGPGEEVPGLRDLLRRPSVLDHE
jgi:uncharacterized protein (DUF1778 family)